MVGPTKADPTILYLSSFSRRSPTQSLGDGDDLIVTRRVVFIAEFTREGMESHDGRCTPILVNNPESVVQIPEDPTMTGAFLRIRLVGKKSGDRRPAREFTADSLAATTPLRWRVPEDGTDANFNISTAAAPGAK